MRGRSSLRTKLTAYPLDSIVVDVPAAFKPFPFYTSPGPETRDKLARFRPFACVVRVVRCPPGMLFLHHLIEAAALNDTRRNDHLFACVAALVAGGAVRASENASWAHTMVCYRFYQNDAVPLHALYDAGRSCPGGSGAGVPSPPPRSRREAACPGRSGPAPARRRSLCPPSRRYQADWEVQFRMAD